MGDLNYLLAQDAEVLRFHDTYQNDQLNTFCNNESTGTHAMVLYINASANKSYEFSAQKLPTYSIMQYFRCYI